VPDEGFPPDSIRIKHVVYLSLSRVNALTFCEKKGSTPSLSCSCYYSVSIEYVTEAHGFHDSINASRHLVTYTLSSR
jgi:hypothetical protein